MIERLDIQTVTETFARIAFTLSAPAFVKATLRSPAGEQTFRTVEEEAVGRMEFPSLAPDTEYGLDLEAGGSVMRMALRTLPPPQGPCTALFAVIGDPHVSMSAEMRRGRLFPESAGILREIVNDLLPRRPDFVLVPGDVTNVGAEEEFRLAREIFARMECPVLTVAGDHDFMDAPHRFEKHLGPLRWTHHVAGFHILGCHTAPRSPGLLGPEGVAHLRAELRSSGEPVILLSHMQLIPDTYIVDEDRSIEDSAAFEREVLPLLPPNSIAYVGHKNVPAQLRRGNLLQLNVPQPVQYPCGYLLVRRHENGLYHGFQPIFSELLNDASRRMGNALKDAKWHDTYRRGSGYAQWNFLGW